MTPKEYVALIQSTVKRRVYTEEDISPDIVSACKAASLSLTDFLKEINERDWTKVLIDHLNPRLDPALIKLLESEAIAIGAIDDPIPDVKIKTLDNGYAILFSTGMREFVYRLSRIIATRFKIGDQPIEAGLHETARLIAEVFWWFKETNVAFGPQYSINNDQMKVANTLAMEAEAFLLCHEVGHILSDTPGMLEKLPNDIIRADVQAHLDEFAADFFGASLVLGFRDEDSPDFATTLQLRYAGIEFMLLIYQCLEKIGMDFGDTHPPACERLAYIRMATRRYCDNDESWLGLSEISRGIELIFDEIMEILDSPSEHAQYFERKAQELLNDLNLALKECTGGVVPDYVNFRQRAGEIFSTGYPESVLELMAQVAKSFCDDVYSEESEDEANDSERWVRFQQYKLLLSFFHELPDGAVKSRFMASLGWQD